MQGRTIIAIPTEYRGVRFLSRLEATWAGAFDLFDMNWEYEPTTFKLSCGSYTPDFLIKSSRESSYMEIKPVKLRSLSSEELEWTETAMKTFALEVAPIHLATSPPGEKGLVTLLRMEAAPGGGVSACTAMIGKCRYCDEFQFYKIGGDFGRYCSCSGRYKTDFLPIDDLCLVNDRELSYMASAEARRIMQEIRDIKFS